MNTAIVKKCLDELAAETPRIEYVRGMLEALYAMHADHPPAGVVARGKPVDTSTPADKLMPALIAQPKKDEETLAMEAMGARGKSVIDELKKTGQLQ